MKQTTINKKITLLFLLCIVAIFAYLTINTYGNWEYALKLRGKRVFAFILVALASSMSTLSFQTLTRNRFLTPGILGLDQLYILIQTSLFFYVGGIQILSQNSVGMFLLQVLVMASLSTAMIYFFMDAFTADLFLFLMVGMVLGSLFSSISTFLQVVMDPNEYDLLQGKLFANFTNVDSHLLGMAAILVLIGARVLWKFAPELDVLHLGRDLAVSLGIRVQQFQKIVLFIISVLTGVATALVGPSTFLGFIITTIGYYFFDTYRHRQLFIGCFLIGVLLLVGGQFFVEQIFKWQTTISTIIQFTGGLFFVGKIILERKKR